MTREEWIKDAQAGIEEAEQHIEKVAFMDSLSDDAKSNLIKSLLGGAVGSAVMGGVGAATAGEGESSLARALRYGTLGALGGTAATGAALTAKDLLMGGRRFPSETGSGRNPVDASLDTLTGSFMKNPLTIAGTLGGGGVALGKGMLKEDELLKNVDDLPIIRRLGDDMVAALRKGRTPVNPKMPRMGPKGYMGMAPEVEGLIEPNVLKKIKNFVSGWLPNARARALQGAVKSTNFRQLGLHSLGKSGNKLWLAAAPVAAALGYAGDRLWRGDND